MKKRNHKEPVKQAAWRIDQWADIVDCGRTTVYNLIAADQIKTVKLGGIRLITTPPEEFLAAQASAEPLPPGGISGAALRRKALVPATPGARGRPRKYPAIVREPAAAPAE